MDLVSSWRKKADIQIAGSTVTKVEDESLVGFNSWCKISSSHFKVRSATYLKYGFRDQFRFDLSREEDADTKKVAHLFFLSLFHVQE